ncbi:MAG: DUF11 domain-containing protein, partial [Chloroflexi bacterium]|nr:DUF11 domain-containing protein [Chloroflexota bacterium]
MNVQPNTTQDILESNEFCNTCHNGTGAYIDTPISTHGNVDFDNRSVDAFQLKCVSCHDPHGSTNLFGIKDFVIMGDGEPAGPVTFTSRRGVNSFDDGVSPANTRLCVTCHQARGRMKHMGGAGHDGHFDFSGENCIVCHPHSADNRQETSDGFMTVPNVDELIAARTQVNLDVTQALSSDLLVAGVPFTYTLTVINYGPQDAGSVVISDTLPVGVELLAVNNPTGGDCSNTAVGVQCNLGDILFEDSVSLSLAVFPEPDLLGPISNRVKVSAMQIDLASDEDVIVFTDDIVRHADLAISQSAIQPSVLAGETLTFRLTIANLGPSLATGVVVEDTLPDGVTLTAITPSQGDCSESQGIVTCQLGALAVNAEGTVVIEAVANTVNTTVANVATVTGEAYDPNPDNNVSDAESSIVWSADISVSQSAQPAAVEVGEVLTYTLIASNAGPVAAPNAVLSDILPDNVTLFSASSSRGACSYSGNLVTCPLGELAAGAELRAQVVVRAPEEPGVLTNTARITADTTDPDPDNNASVLAVSVFEGADLGLSITTNPSIAIPGEELKYSITITNFASTPADGVVLVNTMPAGVTLVSATATQGPCYVNAEQITCQIGTMGWNQQETVTVIVAIPEEARATLVDTATVSFAGSDPNPDNNTATLETMVIPQADLAITQEVSPVIASLGDTLTYTFTVVNNGPSLATNIVVRDPLPTALLLQAVTLKQGTCGINNDVLTCAL